MHTLTTFSQSSLPPSLQGMPLLAMLVTMAFLFGTGLCLQWLYTIIAEMVDDPAPLRHPLTAVRMVKMLFLIAALIFVTPRMVLLMAWEWMSPWWRESLSVGTWVSCIGWAAVLSLAWWIDRTVTPTTRFQLRRIPQAADVIVEPGRKIRGAIIFGLIFVVAFSTTYVRPRDVPTLQQHR